MLINRLLYVTLSVIIIYLTSGAPNPAVAASHPLLGNGTHVCGAIGDQWNKRYSDQYPNRRYARSFAANLDVGKPRTVRLIYFLPNDRAYRAEVVQRLKDDILTVQNRYAEWMGTHGYGEATFRVETDFQDEPMVQDVIGKHPNSYYLDQTFDTVYPEIEERFDLNANVYLTVIDNGIDTISYSGGRAAGGRGAWLGKSSGFGLFPSEFTRGAIAHELGHAFGLWHDFNDPRYIMSYGRGRDQLSACHAGYLSEHPYFNSDTPIEEEQVPTIELISPRLYPAGSNRVSVRLKVSDPDGLHQVLLFVTTIKPHFAAGFLELKACRQLGGEKDTIVEFDYDGVIPSDGFTNLSDPAGHPITIEAVDTDGNVGSTSFTLAEISPHYITSLDAHTAQVFSVSLSPGGRTLASGSADGKVKLWDAATVQSVTTLDEHSDAVTSVSLSKDGTLASGSWDGTVKLWDMGTQPSIATFPHSARVISVSFSPNGKILAAGSWDGTVKLWDVGAQTDIATFPHSAEVTSVSFSPNGAILAAGLWNGTIELWNVETQTSIGTLPHRSRIFSVSFSPNGAILAAGLWNGTVELWDVETQTNIGTLPHGAIVLSVSFSKDGTLASGASDGTVKLWEITTRINFATLWHSSPVHSVSSSSKILASGTDEGTIELWDTSEWMQLRLDAMEAVVEVHIPDRNLRSEIEKTLNIAPGDTISTLDMESLTSLEASEAGIMNLTGLEAATNLSILYLNRNSISDISVVADLTKLTELSIWGNNIADISAVSGLTRLTYLALGSGFGNNSFTDISAVSGLTNLSELFLGNSSITDISVLSGLTRLTVLHLWGNSITDISAVSGLTNLTELYLENNSITDISALSGLTRLTVLHLWGNSISDISPLVANTGLGSGDEIFMQRNPLSYLSIHTHIPALQSGGVTVEFDNQAHPALSRVSGDNQEGMPNETLADLFVVEARDANGFPLVGVPVSFTVVAGDGTLSVTNTTTDGNGRAQSLLTLGPNLGTNTVEVSVEGISQTAAFSAEATPPLPIPTTLEYVSGENQSGLTGEALPNPFVVEVRDQNGDPQEGVTVTFAVRAGGGSLSAATAMTDANGRAESTLTLGSNAGTNTVEASVEGISHIAVFNIVSEVPVPMYWLERGEASAIRRATPDDTGINSVVTRGLQQPAELALDVVNRKVYWTDIKAKAIRCANLDGTGVQDVVTAGLETPNGVALDVAGGMVYWTDWGAKKIQRANFDGTGMQDLVTDRLSLLGGIALDVAGGTMYWVDFGRDTIWRANLDGTGVEALVTSGLSTPFAIALDAAGGKMYWVDKGTHKIQCANLDGTGVQDLLTKAQGIDNPNGIALDVASGTMYWTESSKGKGKIKSASLDGSNVQTLFADLDDPRSIALDIPLPSDAMSTAMFKPQPPSTPDAPAKLEDVNDDGVVDGKDILVVVQHFGKTGEHMADVNGDGVVNLADIAQVALALDDGAAAPLARGDALDAITPERVRQWLTQAKLAGANQEAILALEQLLSLLAPKQTALHPNYPNPFNPETWIPYHLASDTDVQISIYDINGGLVRELDLGQQQAGHYTDRSRAAYWDGRNGFGERVASGVYFYTLTADSFRSTRKMLVGK